MSTVVVVDDEVEVDEDELVEDVVDVEDMVVLVLTRSQSDHESSSASYSNTSNHQQPIAHSHAPHLAAKASMKSRC